MEYRELGPLQVSVVGLGCNQIGTQVDESATFELVDAALDAGINFFDTADGYGDGLSETLLGSALAKRRSEAVIATKFGGKARDGGGGHPDRVRAAVEASLQRLQVDHIDLYQLHRPDPIVPIEDTVGALSELVASGLVRAIGHSNLTGPMIDAAAEASNAAGVAFVSAQNEWSLVERAVEDEIVPSVIGNDVKLIPYYPLASGVLTGKYRLGVQPDVGWRLGPADARRRAQRLDPRVLETVERLRAFAEERQHTLLDLALSWLASHDFVASIIAGATSPDQVRANAAAAGWALSASELADVDGLTTPRG